MLLFIVIDTLAGFTQQTNVQKTRGGGGFNYHLLITKQSFLLNYLGSTVSEATRPALACNLSLLLVIEV